MRIVERSKVAARAGGPEQIRKLPWEKKMFVSFKIAKEIGKKKAMEKIGLKLLRSGYWAEAAEIERIIGIARDIGMEEKAQELEADRLRIALNNRGHKTAQRLIKKFGITEERVREIAGKLFSDLVRQGRYAEAAQLSKYGLRDTEKIAMKAAAEEYYLYNFRSRPSINLGADQIKEASILAAAKELAFHGGRRRHVVRDHFQLTESDFRSAALLSLGMLKEEKYPWYSHDIGRRIERYGITFGELLGQAKKDLKAMFKTLEAITEMGDSEQEFLCRVLRFRQEASDLAIVLRVKNSMKPGSS